MPWSLDPLKAILNSVSFIRGSVSVENAGPQEKQEHSTQADLLTPRPTARSSRKAGGGTSWGSLLPAAGAAKAWLYLRVVALGSDHKAVTWAWGQGGKERTQP